MRPLFKKIISNIRTLLISFWNGNKSIIKKPFALISALLFLSISPLCSAVFYNNASSYSVVAPIELIELTKKANVSQKKISFCFELDSKEKINSWSSNTLSTFFSKHGFRTSYSLAYLGNNDYSNFLSKNEKIYNNNGFSFDLEEPLLGSVIDFRYYNSESIEQDYFAKCYIKKYLKDDASIYNYNKYSNVYPDLTTGVIVSSSFCDRLIEDYSQKKGELLSYDDFIGMAFSSTIGENKYVFAINNIFYSVNKSGEAFLGPKVEEQFGPSIIVDLTKIQDFSDKVKGASVLFQDSVNLELMLKRFSYIRQETKPNVDIFIGNISEENKCSFTTHLLTMIDKYYSSNFFSTENYVLFSTFLLASVSSLVFLILYIRKNKKCFFKTLLTDTILFFLLYKLISFCVLHGKYSFIMFFNIQSFVFPLFIMFGFIICWLLLKRRTDNYDE